MSDNSDELPPPDQAGQAADQAGPAEIQPMQAGGLPTEPAVTPEILKAALKAFRKRLKVTQLDDASRIGRGPLSSGQRTTVAGITPPNQYPRAVWDALVEQGKLKNAGSGTYSLSQ